MGGLPSKNATPIESKVCSTHLPTPKEPPNPPNNQAEVQQPINQIQENLSLKIVVYFGSQTGTAEGFARIVVKETRKEGFDSSLKDLDDFTVDSIVRPHIAIFLIATFGEGEPTDNAKKFYNWVKSQQTSNEGKEILKDIIYCVFGLGSNQYLNFNSTGKFFDSSLSQLGAARLMPLSLGDDQGDIEADFDKWKSEVLNVGLAKFKNQN